MSRAVFRPLLLLALLGLATPVSAQQQPQAGSALEGGTVISPVLTIDSERLFLESAFGKRVAAEIEQKGAALTAEKR